jgi:tetratricopeptide (TPR) repeat protein
MSVRPPESTPQLSAQPAAPADGAQAHLLAALLFTAALALFGQTSQFGFLNFDDIEYVSNCPEVAAGLSPGGVWWAFTHSHVGQWHPLTTLSFMLDASLWGLGSGGFHLHNALLHGLAAVLLFHALRALTGALWRSALAAALFTLHPLRVESVAWIAERKDVLSGVFFMATLWAYAVAARRSPSAVRFAATTVLFALGLLCKPMLVTLPLVLLLLDVWPLRRFPWATATDAAGGTANFWPQLRPLLVEKIPLFALALLAGIVALAGLGEHFNPIPPLALGPRLMFIPVSYVGYLLKAVWPFGLSAHYPYSADGPPLWQFLGSLLLLAALTWLAVKLRRRHPVVLVGWFWFLVTLLPVIGVFRAGVQVWADRYTYTSQIGLAVAAVWLAAQWTEGKFSRRVRALGAAGLLAGLAAVAWAQVQHWKSDLALWRHAVAVTGENFYAVSKLGKALQDQGDSEAAERTYREALRINPNVIEALNNLAALLARRGRFDEAIALQRRAVRQFPRWHLMHHNLGQHLAAKGDYRGAKQAFLRAVALDAADFPSRLALASLLAEKFGDRASLREADDCVQRVIQIHPGLAEARYLQGNIAYQLGRTDEAAAAYRKALELDPRHARAANNLATLAASAGRLDEAIGLFQRAIQNDGSALDSYRNLAETLVKQGAWADAVTVWRAALQRAPHDVRCLARLAWTLSTCPINSVRNGAEAVALARRATDLTLGGDPGVLDVLAAAQAETGRFAEAQATARRALELPALAQAPDLARQIRQRLELYQSGRPFRDAR